MFDLSGNMGGMLGMLLISGFVCMQASAALARGSGSRGSHTHCRKCGSTVSADDVRCPSCNAHLDE